MAKADPAPYLRDDGRVITADPKFHACEDPRYIAAVAKRMELKGRLDAVGVAINAEHSRSAAARSVALRELQTHALVYDTEMPVQEKPVDLQSLYKEQELLADAVRLSDRRVEDVQRAVSAEICKPLRATYIRIAESCFTAIRELHRLHRLERDFHAELENGGTITEHLPPLGVFGGARLAFAEEEICMQALTHYEVKLDRTRAASAV
jgi:hypothetical protein